MLSIATDFSADTGEIAHTLKEIRKAGFTAIHWCHHWNTDFAYLDCEMNYIQEVMHRNNLQLLDLHGTTGPERDWQSLSEHKRIAGVELVKNRVEMTSLLGGDCVIMHAQAPSNDKETKEKWLQQLEKSLTELEPFCGNRGIRIALENLSKNNFNEVVLPLLGRYSDKYIGVCYDSGHDNFSSEVQENGFEELQAVGERLISLHLHDNDGSGDEHKIPFTGTINWEKCMAVIKKCGYNKIINMEITMDGLQYQDVEEFLQAAYTAGEKLHMYLNG